MGFVNNASNRNAREKKKTYILPPELDKKFPHNKENLHYIPINTQIGLHTEILSHMYSQLPDVSLCSFYMIFHVKIIDIPWFHSVFAPSPGGQICLHFLPPDLLLIFDWAY